VALGSLYGPDGYSTNVNPANVRQVNTAFTPNYFAEEQQYMLRVAHDFGAVKVQATGMYQSNSVDSQVDYSLAILDRNLFAPGINNLIGLAQALPQFQPTVDAILPNGANGQLCASQSEFTGTGAFGGFKTCSDVPLAFDRSNEERSTWTGELIVNSQFDGPFNFLLGGIYVDQTLPENSYFVNGFGIDYVAGVLGAATAVGNPALGNIYLGTPFFRNNTDEYKLQSYGLFGEIYYNFSDTFKITAGLRYNNDKKSVRARSTLASFAVPVNATNAFDSPFVGAFDADPGTPGNQLFQERNVSFSEFTGRVVLDWQVSDDSLLYASYSRGYKSGGINPPLQPIFAVPESFTPEFVNAFEIGSKNTFLDGALRANITAFYYQYKGLQLSRIVARTSVNDNVDATVYGLEGEFIIQPTRALAINLGASYLNTRVSQDKFLSNPRDPSGGRSDAVIIKDITNGSNCAVVPTGGGGAALTNGYVTAVNSALGLRAPTGFGPDSGINGATGAFGICGVLAGNAAASGVEVLAAGVESNLNGNQLPQAPEFKFSAGMQYTADFDNGMSLIPRVDLAHTGQSFGNIFNGVINRIESYTVINAQIQLNGKDDRWYLRGFVQNLANNSATTGLYVTDQSSGLFTNIFTLEPRRYGVAAGFRF
jgi:outer membrane receptor protein involved in Fe transport